MKQLKCYAIIGIIFVIILGTLSHFLYEWTKNNFLVGFFTPVNESTWEHMKLLFFPMLLYLPIMIFKFKKIFPYIIPSLCLGILLGTSLIPIFFYGYTYILGKNVFILDFATFVFSVIIAFFAAYKFTLSCKLQPHYFSIYSLVCIYFICFILFTYQPPDAKLFADPTISHSSSATYRLNAIDFCNLKLYKLY